MPKPPRSTIYRPVARTLHGSVALIVLAMIPAGLVMIQPGLDRSVQNLLFLFHKNVGGIVVILMLWRIAYRAAHPPPSLPDTVPLWQQRLAALTHFLLYASVLIMAISGYVRVVAGGFPLEWWDALDVPRLAPRSDAVAELAKTIHWATHYILIALVTLHIGAALFHAVIKRDGVVLRMWPTARR